ncbi:hypothetical protein A9Q99_24925 [Gammaproteobacteria bacterium 45_16_T64]|nr:hypothetical protein A9Q99_24925 [Gammaproteobacteria bacterium 45_16_T64]
MSKLKSIASTRVNVNKTPGFENGDIGSTLRDKPAAIAADPVPCITPNHWSNYPDYKPLAKTSINEIYLKNQLGSLGNLIGTWRSTPQNGYSVMPIPCAENNSGYKLDTFFYYEEISFSIIAENGTNDTSGESYSLYYEQSIFFSDGPLKDQLAHSEKGTFLHLSAGSHSAENDMFSPVIVKQISAPNGNSIFVDGTCKTTEEPPEIPDASSLPSDAPHRLRLLYGPDTPYNPRINPNIVLQGALSLVPDEIERTTLLHLSSRNFDSAINMSYMKHPINISSIDQKIWIEEFSNGTLQIQYSQNTSMNYALKNTSDVITFQHIFANTLRKIR